MTKSEIVIQEGIGEEHVEDALLMTYDAFAKKFYIGFSNSEQFIRLFRDALNQEYCLAAIDNGELVGLLIYQVSGKDFFGLSLRKLFSRFNPIRALRILTNLLLLHSGTSKDEFMVDALVVDPRTRGSGIGTKLLSQAEDKARELGKTKMKLSVIGENTGAIRLYERVGYTTYRTEKGIWVRLVIKSEEALDMEKAL